MNIGYNPTIDDQDNKINVEVHILDFDKDIYGKELIVTVTKYLRAEKKCNDLESLKKLIQSDVLYWREYLKEDKHEI
jgi:riboflavin kinase/FMN adenylyltransferase